MSYPQTDIVLPVRNALDDFRECIATVRAHTHDYRLIFVDDFSDDVTAQVIREEAAKQSSSLLVRTSSQRWFTRAVNLGLRLVRTDRCMILNSDCVVGDGWLQELYDVWDEAASTGLKIGLVGDTHSDPEPRRWRNAFSPDYVTGHAWLVSMEALFVISAARGMPGIYLNERDASCIHIASDRIGSWELNEHGFATIGAHKAAVGHKGGRSWGFRLGDVSGLRILNQLTGEVGR
jgi:glycosyltransferase involved in cell wall biosynthesis